MATYELTATFTDRASAGLRGLSTNILGVGRAATVVNNGLGTIRNTLGAGLRAAATVGVAGLTALTTGFVALGVRALQTGSDLEEQTSRFNVLFGDLSDETVAGIDSIAEATGRNRFALQGYAADLQGILVPMGLTRDQAAELSVDMTQLAVDTASFLNRTEDDVLQRFNAALLGSSEAVAALGVPMNAAAVDAELLAMGISGGTAAASQAEVIMARYNIIVRALGDAQGDAERTSGSWANQQRALTSIFEETVATIGTKLVPILTPLLVRFNEFANDAAPAVIQAVDDTIGLFETLVPLLQNTWTAFANGKDIIETVRDLIINLELALGSNLNQALESGRAFTDLWDRISGGIETVRAFLQPLTDWIQRTFELTDVLAGIRGVIVFLITGALAPLFATLAQVAIVFVAAVAVARLLRAAWESDFAGIRTAVTSIIDGVGPRFLEFVNNVREWLLGVALPAVQTFVNNVGTALAPFVAFITSEITPRLSELGAIFLDIFGQVGEFIEGSIVPILQDFGAWFIDEGLPAIGQFAAVAIPAFIDGLIVVATIVRDVAGVVLPALGAAIQFVRDNWASISPIITAVGAVIIAFAIGPILAVGAAIGALAGLFVSNFETIRTAVINAMTSAQETLASVTAAITGFVQPFLEALTAFWQNHGDSVITVVTFLVDQVVALWTALVGLIQPIVEAWLASIQANIEVFVTIVTTLWSNMSDNLGVIVSTLATTLQTLFENGLTAIGAVFDIFAALIEGDWEALWDGIKLFLSTVLDNIVTIFTLWVTTVTELWTGILDTIAALVTEFEWDGLGGDIVAGIATGISNAASQIGDALVSAAQGALAQAQALLGIESPSRVAAALVGAPISQGVAVGIAQGAREVNREVDNLVNGLFAGAAGLGAAAQTAVSGGIAGASGRLGVPAGSGGPGALGGDPVALASALNQLFSGALSSTPTTGGGPITGAGEAPLGAPAGRRGGIIVEQLTVIVNAEPGVDLDAAVEQSVGRALERAGVLADRQVRTQG